MSFKDYYVKLTKLASYAPTLVADSTAQISKFISASEDVVKEIRTATLVNKMDILFMLKNNEKKSYREGKRE